MKTRILPPEEWGRLKDGQLPELLPLVEPHNVAVVVVEDDTGEIIACLSALQATFLEGLWVAPEQRKNPGVVRALLRLASAVPRVRGERWAFCSTETEKMQGYVRRLGGKPMSAGIHVLPIGA